MYSEISANKRKTWMIMFGFLAFVVLIAYLFGRVQGNYTMTIAITIGSIIYALIQYFAADKIAAAVNGARQIQKSDNPRLWRIVENLSITDGLPMPRVYIIEDPAPNAFASGRDPSHALVCATTGILDVMNDTELEGVFAHELGHIKNYDIRVSMIAFGLVSVIGILSDFFLRMSFFGTGGNDRDNENNNGGGIFALLAFAAAIIAPLVAVMLQLAISRRREYLADATGALTTRYPEGLASALSKLQKTGTALKRQNASTAHLFFANPLSKKSLLGLFSTHPPLEDRIKKLRAMEASA